MSYSGKHRSLYPQYQHTGGYAQCPTHFHLTVMRQYVSYLRVSTHKQGYSGLGIEARRTAVSNYMTAVGGVLLAEHVEVENRSSKMRPVLNEAIKACRRDGAILVIAKLDRLARNVAFVSSLMEGAVARQFSKTWLSTACKSGVTIRDCTRSAN